MLSMMLTKRKDANSFHADVEERSFREECCGEGCNFEERAEHSESHNWDHVGKVLCEYSVREG